MVGDILQPTHLLFVLVVALLVLGPKRLPEVGRTLGNGIRDFRAAINGETVERRDEIEDDVRPWRSEPDEKHEFAHTGDTTPEDHEFAHDETAAAGTSTADATVEPATAGADASEQSATVSASDKHEFAHQASEPSPDASNSQN